MTYNFDELLACCAGINGFLVLYLREESQKVITYSMRLLDVTPPDHCCGTCDRHTFFLLWPMDRFVQLLT